MKRKTMPSSTAATPIARPIATTADDPYNLDADDCPCPDTAAAMRACRRCDGWAHRCPLLSLGPWFLRRRVDGVRRAIDRVLGPAKPR